MPDENDSTAAIQKEIDGRQTKNRRNLAKAGLRQTALVILMDRFTTRAVNDRKRKGPLPTPETARKAVIGFVPAVIERAEKLSAEDKELTPHAALLLAAEQLEKEPPAGAKKSPTQITAQPAAPTTTQTNN